MKKLFFILIIWASIPAMQLSAQIKTQSGKSDVNTRQTTLTGTWRLIEFADRDTETAEWIYPFGKKPKGYFTYTASGIVNLNISAETPLKISRDSATNRNIDLATWLDHNAEGYFGTYTIDFNKSIVTHHVKGGSIPWYIDTDQPRPFILKGDTLIIGDNKTWKRVLVRED